MPDRLPERTRIDGDSVPAAPSRRQRRASSPADPYLPGEIISDRYRLTRELGRGGMGVVWAADSLVLGIDVALKLIETGGADTETTSRMAREAHAAARLGHPALVRVFDFGWTSRGTPFLVMELVQGDSLAALIDRDGRIAAVQAVRTLLPVADGLRLAHDSGIIHRDLKPANIFLATDSLGRVQPKLLDFGIAKIDSSPAHTGKITQVGVVLGSPEYMSPEQALGDEELDQRTDVWSLSVVLYEMVSGVVPFARPNYNALMQAIVNDEPAPLPELCAGDPALWLVIKRGLAKRREQRWASMTEFGEALALWLYEHGVKEDLAGNSVRAVWLDGVLSGLRIEVPLSAAPELDEPTVATRAARTDTQSTQPRGAAAGRFAKRTLLGTRIRWALALLVAVVVATVLPVWLLATETRARAGPTTLHKPASLQTRPNVEAVQRPPAEPPATAQPPAAIPTAQSTEQATPSVKTPRKSKVRATQPQRRPRRSTARPLDFGF